MNTHANPVGEFKIKRITADRCVDVEDRVAIEEPLEIQLSYGLQDKTQTNISVTMRTPGNDDELAVGFLFSEGILQSADQIKAIKSMAENEILVELNDDIKPCLQKSERNFYTTSSCGVCGKSSIAAIRTVSLYQHGVNNIIIDSKILYGLEGIVRKQQSIFESTGALHACGLFDLHGDFIMLREDVGRHNALDKVIGTALMSRQLPLTESILFLSGRASFELIQKASMAGIKIVAAVGAPSSLAVELAMEFDMTLIGFLRNERFNIYCGWQRVGGKGEVESLELRA